MPKPSFVTWEEVRNCLIEAHASNRENGIIMTHHQWTADKIADLFDGVGELFVAMDGEKLVGTLGIIRKEGKHWFAKGIFAYACFGSILSPYRGLGIYKSLNTACEDYTRKIGLDIIVLDTHSKNIHMQRISLRGGYRRVRFFQARSKDHFCVMMAKWLNVCPFSKLHCTIRFYYSKVLALTLSVLKH